MRGGKRPGAGRKAVAEELKIHTNISKYLPQSMAFIEWCFSKEATKDYKKWATELVLKKTIPDKKAVEVTGQDGEPIKLIINAGNGFIPSAVTSTTTPTGSYFSGSTSIQGDGVAQTGEENDNSNNGAGQASAS